MTIHSFCLVPSQKALTLFNPSPSPLWFIFVLANSIGRQQWCFAICFSLDSSSASSSSSSSPSLVGFFRVPSIVFTNDNLELVQNMSDDDIFSSSFFFFFLRFLLLQQSDNSDSWWISHDKLISRLHFLKKRKKPNGKHPSNTVISMKGTSSSLC